MYTRNTNSGEIKTTFIAISHVLQGKNIMKRSAQKQNNNCTFVAEKREVDGLIFCPKDPQVVQCQHSRQNARRTTIVYVRNPAHIAVRAG